MFEFIPTNIGGLLLIKPIYYSDNRGVLKKVFEKNIFEQNNIEFSPYEEIETTSEKNTLRGLHYQTKNSQAKLIRVAYGKIFDVAVDLRKNSPTFGHYYSTILSDQNKLMLYIPAGFAHGCLTLSTKSIFYYLCDSPYEPQYDTGIIWNDAHLLINWPIKDIHNLIISKKDLALPNLSDHNKLEL